MTQIECLTHAETDLRSMWKCVRNQWEQSPLRYLKASCIN